MQALEIAYQGTTPDIDDTAYIAPGAAVIGRVSIAAGASVWFGCVLRGDDVSIAVGEGSNIQDGTVIHGDEGEVAIGKNVTIGHRAVIHGCTIHDNALVGMGAVVLDGAVIESGAMVAAGAVVSPGKVVKAGTLWAGCPARELKNIDNEDTRAMLLESAVHYQHKATLYQGENNNR